MSEYISAGGRSWVCLGIMVVAGGGALSMGDGFLSVRVFRGSVFVTGGVAILCFYAGGLGDGGSRAADDVFHGSLNHNRFNFHTENRGISTKQLC